jgi:protein-tyrosine phosphatase
VSYLPCAEYQVKRIGNGTRAVAFAESEELPGLMRMNETDDMPGRPADPEHAGIVVLCTANVCRSPMAASLLGRRLGALGAAVPVRSAGMFRGGDPPFPEVISVMASYGIEIASHRSRVASAADLARASLVLAMARDNLRHAVITEPGAWPRAFTLKEVIRHGERIGPRPPGEPLSQWLLRAHAGRERASLLGDSAEDDVADPAGGPLRAYAETARVLDRLVSRLAVLGWAHAGPDPLTAAPVEAGRPASHRLPEEQERRPRPEAGR